MTEDSTERQRPYRPSHVAGIPEQGASRAPASWAGITSSAPVHRFLGRGSPPAASRTVHGRNLAQGKNYCG